MMKEVVGLFCLTFCSHDKSFELCGKS
jgi:hypothetical protein